MKTPTIALVYDFKHESRIEGRPGTVYVRIYEHGTRRRTYISTDVRILPHEWDQNLECVVGRDDAYVLNRKIQAQLSKCKEHIADAASSGDDLPKVRAMKVDRSSCSWLDYMLKKIESNTEINESTRKQHMVTYRALEEWGGMKRFDQVTKRNILAFRDHVASRSVSKMIEGKLVDIPISQPTVYGYFKRLRVYINSAIVDGYLPMNTLVGVNVEKGRGKVREYLTDEEMERWSSADPSQEYLKCARDRFIVQMSCGLSYEDFMRFDYSRHEVVNGQMVLVGQRKKSGEQFFTVMLPMGVEIMERWGWHVPKISNTDYNVYLGLVAKIAGINKHVTSHVARHTYACYILRHGVRIEAVQQALGHKKITTTQIYARLAGVDVIDAFSKMR